MNSFGGTKYIKLLSVSPVNDQPSSEPAFRSGSGWELRTRDDILANMTLVEDKKTAEKNKNMHRGFINKSACSKEDDIAHR